MMRLILFGRISLEKFHMIEIPLYSVKLIQDRMIELPSMYGNSEYSVGQIASHLLGEYDREHLLSIFINNKGKVTGLHTIAIGYSSGLSTTPLEVFRAALIAGAPAMVLAHNHPSGDLTPSKQDVEMTERMIEVSKSLGVTILDHVIVSPTAFRSMSPEISGGFT